jgi:hypothetical protein
MKGGYWVMFALLLAGCSGAATSEDAGALFAPCKYEGEGWGCIASHEYGCALVHTAPEDVFLRCTFTCEGPGAELCTSLGGFCACPEGHDCDAEDWPRVCAPPADRACD